MAAESSLEARVAHVEGILDEVRSRFGTLENRMDRLESSVNGRIDKLESSIASRLDRADDRQNTLEGRMQTQFQWLVGLMITMGVSVLLAVLLKG